MTFLCRLTDQCKLLNEFGMAHETGGDVQFVRVDIDHVARPVRMSFTLDGGEKNSVTIVPGYTPVYLPLPAVKMPHTASVTAGTRGKELLVGHADRHAGAALRLCPRRQGTGVRVKDVGVCHRRFLYRSDGAGDGGK